MQARSIHVSRVERACGVWWGFPGAADAAITLCRSLVFSRCDGVTLLIVLSCMSVWVRLIFIDARDPVSSFGDIVTICNKCNMQIYLLSQRSRMPSQPR